LIAYDIIHFACHGQFDDSQERLSSFLRLADRDLRISDIFDLKLDASLVVLSGCQTGLSKVLTGDELIGLARGFFYAGTPSLICTLWSVNDRSTADFMGDFYKNFLELNNRSKSSALRLSQLHLKEKYEHPYFWAPFFLIGDYI
jgi:CHAT domain-containing protein